ncbi:hypothetical protein ES703_109340 [subsurface metagenome]
MNILDGYRAKVEDELRLLVQKGSTPLLGLDTMNAYHMGFCDRDGNPSDSSKGKYLRPLFCLAMCAGLGGDPEQAIPAAAALELVHRTSLIFDDIQDKGQERNNQPTVWAIWGANQTINGGLALSCYARLAVHRLTLRNVPNAKVLGIQSVLENAVIDLCHGQYMDISFVDAITVSVEDYLQMVRGKTGTLFATSCAVGAMLATPEQDEVSLAWEFGLNIGMAFQIRDDYLGVWGNEAVVGKTANDLVEKKRSLPLVLALQIDPDTIGGWLKHSPANENEVRILKGWMEEKGIPEQVNKVERRFIKHARENLKALSLGQEWQDQFEEVLSFLAERKI